MRDWRADYDKIVALNYSNAKRLLKSGKEFKEGRGPKEDSEHIVVGTMVHAMVLEGKDLRKTYAIKPAKMSFATTVGKQWRDAQTLPILENEAAERVPRMADAIACNEFARSFIKLCPLREHVVIAPMNGVRCKGMLDMVGHDRVNNPGFCEIKTLPDARKAFFRHRICSEPFFYDGQVCWYRRLLALATQGFGEGGLPLTQGEPPSTAIWSVWIACENRPPFDVAVYTPTDRMLASGEERLRDLFTTYHACEQTKSWPGVQPHGIGIEPLDPPRWRIKQMENEYEDTY
jgi:PDDEXK-like domain of unknown function (DUF3799)